MHSKKSQSYVQIFVYILSIIIFAFILIYGYNSIKGFMEKSEQVAYIKFKTDLKSSVDRISSDPQTVRIEEFFIGGDYNRVCFVQSYKQNDNYNLIIRNITSRGDLIVEDSVSSGVNKNVFLFSPKNLKESFDVGPINVSGGYFCVNVVNGRIKIMFEGGGDHASISLPTSLPR